MIHMCSQSDGACAMIFASEEKAKKLCKQPAGSRTHNRPQGESFAVFEMPRLSLPSVCGRKAVQTLRDQGPTQGDRRLRDVRPLELVGLDWLREFLLLEGDEHFKMVENGEITMKGLSQ